MDDKKLIERIAEQETRIQFESFSTAMAHEIGLRLLQIAREKALPLAIDITRSGQCLFHCAMEGASPDNAAWIKRKIRVVERFGHSSLYMGAVCRLAGKTSEEKFLLPESEYAAHGGAFPMILKGTGVIGSVAVSGLPQVEDHELVVSVLEEFL